MEGPSTTPKLLYYPYTIYKLFTLIGNNSKNNATIPVGKRACVGTERLGSTE